MKARTLIFTGDGKGKTTAAFGMVLRAAGHGMRTMVIQFLKSNSATGELAACRNLPGVEVAQMGRGFVPPPGSAAFDAHRSAALEALARAEEVCASNQYDLIVLDEACGAAAHGLIPEEALIRLMDAPERLGTLVLTGRNASAALIERADTVTEMRTLRHGYQQGIAAQKGVEF